jgi:dCMP deaminase
MRPNLDEYMLQLLPLLASRGTCPRRRVAAIVTDESGHLLGTGYNGVAAGFPHCVDIPCPGAIDQPGNNSRCEAQHAEANAILQGGANLIRATRLYCSCTPCFNCAKLIVAAAIPCVVVTELYQGDLSGLRYLLTHHVRVLQYVGGAPQILLLEDLQDEKSNV